MPKHAEEPRPMSQLEIDRLKLLRQLGLTTDHAPPCWQDEHDPTKIQRSSRARKLSVQVAYATKIASPIRKREKGISLGTTPTYLDQVVQTVGSNPGPGEYYNDDTKASLTGGQFSTAYPKSELDWIEVKGPTQPGPGYYTDEVTNRGMPFKSCRNGKLSSSDRVTELDVLQARARQVPGPSGGAEPPRNVGVKFSTANVPSELDLVMRRANMSPAPHDYGVPSNLKSTGGGQFSTAFPPTALEATIRSKRGIPGPGSYRVQASSGKYVGKVPMARTPSEADRQVELSRDRPGPGAYHQPMAVRQLPGVTRWSAITRPAPPPKKEKWAPYAMEGPKTQAERVEVLQKSRKMMNLSPASKAASGGGGGKGGAARAAASMVEDDNEDSYGEDGFI